MPSKPIHSIMESIRIEQTQKSPLVVMRDGYVLLSGRSIPQNAAQLYKICFDWVRRYIQQPAKETRVDLYFEYIDSSSIRCVLELLTLLDSISARPRKHVEMNWYYEKEDEDSHDLGAYIGSFMKSPFHLMPDNFSLPSLTIALRSLCNHVQAAS
jgi:hypothetical protein